jgi:hypothetical protein
VASLAGGGVSLILHIDDEESEPVWALSRKRGQALMIAAEEID